MGLHERKSNPVASVPAFKEQDIVPAIEKLLSHDWIEIAVFEHAHTHVFPKRGPSDSLTVDEYIGFAHPVEWFGAMQFDIEFDDSLKIERDTVGCLRIFGYSDPGKLSCRLFLSGEIRGDFEMAFENSVRGGMTNFHLNIRLDNREAGGLANETYLRKYGYPEQDFAVTATSFKNERRHIQTPSWFDQLVRV